MNMDKIATIGTFAAVLIIGASVGASCTPQQAKSVLQKVLSAEQLACVLAQAELSGEDADMAQTVCRVANDLRPDLERVLSAHKIAAAKVSAARKAKDAGAD